MRSPRSRRLLSSCIAALALGRAWAGAPDPRADFAEPPARWKPRPLWFWNAPPSRAQTHAIIEGCRASGYQGFGILPTAEMGLEFMSAEYLDRYEEAVDKAAELGMNMCLYDEFWFPSGGAGGQLARAAPQALGKRLDMAAADVTGPQSYATDLPPGTLMAAVAMEEGSRQRVDLTRRVARGRLAWDVPAGSWKVMLFTCVPDGARGLVDYLDPDAVREFIALTYEKYHGRLAQHFGSTIDSAFYDEPTFHWIEGGRAWTPSFNERFRARHGFDPAPLYPALWHDIGPETAAARNLLFGFRAELFATGFVKTVADWCRDHGIELTGHVDQEEIVNPVGLCGDLIKVFEHQPIPGIDQIFQYGRGSRAYKIVSSAAANYDRRLVMTECYGAIKDMPVANLYREAMDQFAKGINVMVPHAVWYSTDAITFPPELSFRDPTYGPELPAYNRYVGRLQRLLQEGHPVADIGVLYPIAGLQAAYRFGPGTPYEGGVVPEEADYMEVGERLALELRHDYTFVHPDVLDARCDIAGATLRLGHPTWAQDYRVVVLPGARAIRWNNLEKIRRFHDNGGTVIATTVLPEQAAEPGRDADVRAAVAAMFDAAVPAGAALTRRLGTRGGSACFVPDPAAAALGAALAGAVPVWDVEFEDAIAVRGGNLSYLHKTCDGRDIYFFANSSDTRVECWVRLRGALDLEEWDPHTGGMAPAAAARGDAAGQAYTRIRLVLSPVESRFFVARPRSGS